MSSVPRSFEVYSMAQLCAYRDFEIRREGPRRSQPRLHRHDYFQVHFHIAGPAQMHLADASRPLAPGMLSFILPDRLHYMTHPPGSKYYVMSFGLQFLRADLCASFLELEDIPLWRAPELAPFRFQDAMDFQLEGEQMGTAVSLCEQMLQENEARSFYSLEWIRSHLFALIGLVARKHAQDFQQSKAEHQTRMSRSAAVRRVDRFLRESYMNRVTLDDAAQAVCLSPNYLSHLLKRERGKSFLDLLAGLRMDAAKALLRTTDLRVADVAARSGFKDEAYFSRRFRQIEGCAPTEFRELELLKGPQGDVRTELPASQPPPAKRKKPACAIGRWPS